VSAARVCIVTGSRAEYGLFRPLLRALSSDPAFEPYVVVTGQHLAERFGLTVREVEADPWRIGARVEIPLEDDTEAGMTRATATALTGFADAFAAERPDLVVVLGDRFETFAVATAAFLARIPIAHLHGGELTFGALDDGMRHAITKLATLHFTSTEEYARRVINMGEDPARVHVVGAIGLDNVLAESRCSREELETETGFTFGEKSALVTFHPATVDGDAAQGQTIELTGALSRLVGYHVLVTHPNADAHGRAVADVLTAWVAEDAECRTFVESLGVRRYLSVVREVDVVVGNSSSGLIEVPSLGTPTVDIGDRQEGRVRPASVVHCEPMADEIVSAIKQATSPEFASNLVLSNPYGDGRTAPRIVEELRVWLEGDRSIKKRFYEGGE